MTEMEIAGSWISILHQTGDETETTQTLTLRICRPPPYTRSHTLQRQNEQLWCVLSFLWHPCSSVVSVETKDVWGAVTFAADGGKLINDKSWQTVTLRIAFFRGAVSGVPITRIRIQFTHIFTFRWSKHKTAVWESTSSPPDSLTHSPSSGTPIELKGRLLVNSPTKIELFCSLKPFSKNSLTSSLSYSVFWNMLFTVAWTL